MVRQGERGSFHATYSRRQKAEGRRQEAGGKTITVPSIHACHYVLKGVTTAIQQRGSLFDRQT
ncbi:hypothetical protein [Dendronalium phyllosphericum]|uniref:hypothetical protein n=1 Tax=Dendronalium phyllosphericum TaxID=2840445 RepID=UPI001CEC3429|nr:hypothetical protein [Dendronalium phyllosphericum]